MVLTALALMLALQQSPLQSGQPTAPPCAASDDATYGFTMGNAVQVGGGAMYAAARERRYLDALRGPAGQAIRYKRLGSTLESPNGQTIFDKYEVTYDGLDKPVFLFLDAYHYWEQRAPKGFICAQSPQLQPILDNLLASESLRSAAAEQSPKQVAPIPLDGDGTTTHGVVFDLFRMIARTPRTPPPADGKPVRTAPADASSLVVAYPLSCDGKRVNPVAIDFVPVQPGPAMAPTSDLMKEAAIAALLPDATVPAGSLAARFPLTQMSSAFRARITYAEPACPQGTTQVALSFNHTAPRLVDAPEPSLPEGANPADKALLLQVLIDLDGRMQAVTYVGGPVGLRQAAIDAVKTWRAEPSRINGAPVPFATLLQVRFK